MSSATSSAIPSGRRSWQGSSPLPETGICIVNFLCRPWRHHESALSFDAEKEGAGCGASATGWRIGLILRAPCSAAARAIPRKTTCGGFWYFWPQKYKKKKVCGNCDFPEPSQTFSVKFRKTFFSAFRWRKAAKATRPIPMSASGRLKAASGDCAGLQANRPRRSRFQPFVRFSAIGTKSGIALRVKIKHTLPERIYFAAIGGTTNPHSRLTRKKRGRAAARPPRGGA